MNFQLVRDDMTGTVRFQGEFTAQDLLRLDLDMFDRAILNQPCECASDYLCALELLFRRNEQATADEIVSR